MPRRAKEKPAEPQGEAPGEGHNSREQKEILLLNHVANLRQANASITVAMSAVKVAKKAAKLVRNAAKLDGFTLKILDEALEIESQVGERREQERQAEERVFVFETLGLPLGMRQGELDLPAPKRDAKFWGDLGYQRGIAGEPQDAADVPPEFLQAYLKRHTAGAEKLAWAQAERGQNPERVGGVGTGPTARELGGDDDDEDDDDDGQAVRRVEDPLLN
jgi:hypothetical protein